MAGLEREFPETAVDVDLDEEPSAMDALPDELLLCILQHVGVSDLVVRVGGVCRRWQRLARDPALWRRQTLHYRSCTSDEDFTASLLHAPRLDKLDLTGLQAGSAAERGLQLLRKARRGARARRQVREGDENGPRRPRPLSTCVLVVDCELVTVPASAAAGAERRHGLRRGHEARGIPAAHAGGAARRQAAHEEGELLGADAAR